MSHRLLNGSLFDPSALPELMRGELADAVYSDPPWGPGNLRYWGTAANVRQRGDWPAFVDVFVRAMAANTHDDAPVWIEMGERWADELRDALDRTGRPVRATWTTLYRSGSRLLPATLLYSGPALPDGFDPSALRGAALPRACLAASGLRAGAVVLDPCCGKGYTARACVRLGLSFRGLELNAQRMAVTQAWLNRS